MSSAAGLSWPLILIGDLDWAFRLDRGVVAFFALLDFAGDGFPWAAARPFRWDGALVLRGVWLFWGVTGFRGVCGFRGVDRFDGDGWGVFLLDRFFGVCFFGGGFRALVPFFACSCEFVPELTLPSSDSLSEGSLLMNSSSISESSFASATPPAG